MKQIDNTLEVKPQPKFPDRTKEVEEAKRLAEERIRQAEAEAQRVAEEERLAAIRAAEAQAAQAAAVAAQRAAYSVPVARSYSNTARPYVGGGNAYSYGQCTYYVKNRRPDIGSYWGNAGNWLYAARQAGYSTGSAPRVGAIAWTSSHVAYVESISGGMVTVSEMNWWGNGGGWNRVSYRTAPASNFQFIY